MAIWGKKKLKDLAIKFFSDNNVSLESAENDILSFELYLRKSEFSVFPYLKINEDDSELSFLINLRKLEENENVFEKINDFNLDSKLFTAKVSKDNILFLEYNLITDTNTIKDDLKNIIENVLAIQEAIDNL